MPSMTKQQGYIYFIDKLQESMKANCRVGMFTNKRGTSSSNNPAPHKSMPYLQTSEVLNSSLQQGDYGLPYEAGKIRRKTLTRTATQSDLVSLQRENMKLRAELMDKELSQRQYIQRILELEHEVMNITNRLAEMQKVVTDRKINFDKTKSQALKPNISILEGLSLIQQQTSSAKKDITVSLATASSYEELKQYNKIAELVTKKVNLKDTKEVYDYVKTCMKFTETVKQNVTEIFPIYEINHNKEIKVVWKKLKGIISEWLQFCSKQKQYSPSKYLSTAHI